MTPEQFINALEALRPGISFSWNGDDYQNFSCNDPTVEKPTWDEILAVQLPEPKVIDTEIVEPA